MPENDLTIRVIIGLEVHVQLATRTKLFCGCPVEFGAQPNSRVCPVCLGLPGVLPVMNRRALELAVRTGLALNCKIAPVTKLERKGYYYPDLPKNYQISQYDLPLCYDGHFDVPVGGQTTRVRIIRAHLEEDAGKNIHDTPGCTLVDLNRTGTPLLEIVTEPDLQSAEQAHTFAVELQRLVTYLGVSEGVMQKGQMRFEPNVNVAIARDGQEYRTPISEIKNLNSFRALRRAIEYEAERQVKQWRADNGYLHRERPNENRGWNDDQGVTELQRTKEEAHEYRYFPEPDLVPVEVETDWLDGLRASMRRIAVCSAGRVWKPSSACHPRMPRPSPSTWRRPTCSTLPSRLAVHRRYLPKQFVNVWAKLAHERDIGVAALTRGRHPRGRTGQAGGRRDSQRQRSQPDRRTDARRRRRPSGVGWSPWV